MDKPRWGLGTGRSLPRVQEPWAIEQTPLGFQTACHRVMNDCGFVQVLASVSGLG